MMNIFVTDENPVTATTNLCDCHVVKMILESTQLLCTHDSLKGQTRPYKQTHINHPCRRSLSNIYNYIWLTQHLSALLLEYTHRYNKVHSCQQLFNTYWEQISKQTVPFERTSFPLCMPDEFKASNVVTSYRAYYKYKEQTLTRFTYKNRTKPDWL